MLDVGQNGDLSNEALLLMVAGETPPSESLDRHLLRCRLLNGLINNRLTAAADLALNFVSRDIRYCHVP